MPVAIRLKERKPFENMLGRFKKQCEKEGIFSDIRKREYYEKPSVNPVTPCHEWQGFFQGSASQIFHSSPA